MHHKVVMLRQLLQDTDVINELSLDERKEIFLTILPGATDITYDLLVELGSEYDMDIDSILPKQE